MKNGVFAFFAVILLTYITALILQNEFYCTLVALATATGFIVAEINGLKQPPNGDTEKKE